MQALYKLEEIYGLYPTEVDGHIHFVFRDSIAMDNFKPDIDAITRNPGALLQYRILGFMKACALHDAGELTDEEYALWKSKFPAFLGDFYDFGNRRDSLTTKPLMGTPPFPRKNRSPRSGAGSGNQQRAVAGKRQNAAQPDQRSGLFKGFGMLPNKQKQRFPATPGTAVSSLVGTKTLLAR